MFVHRPGSESHYYHVADCQKYMRNIPVQEWTDNSICKVACNAYSKSLSLTNLVSSIQKAGIYEFKQSVVNKSVFKPAEVLKKSEVTSAEVKSDEMSTLNQNVSTQPGG